jgi:hypothetical protein
MYILIRVLLGLYLASLFLVAWWLGVAGIYSEAGTKLPLTATRNDGGWDEDEVTRSMMILRVCILMSSLPFLLTAG